MLNKPSNAENLLLKPLMHASEMVSEDQISVFEQELEFSTDDSPRVYLKEQKYKRNIEDNELKLDGNLSIKTIPLNKDDTNEISVGMLSNMLRLSIGKLICVKGYVYVKPEKYEGRIGHVDGNEYSQDIGVQFTLIGENKNGFQPLKDLAISKGIDLETELVSRGITRQQIIDAIKIHLITPHISGKADGDTNNKIAQIVAGEEGE